MVLANFELKTVKTGHKACKKSDQPCVFGIPADTMMTPL
jgi:hypothetical protein